MTTPSDVRRDARRQVLNSFGEFARACLHLLEQTSVLDSYISAFIEPHDVLPGRLDTGAWRSGRSCRALAELRWVSARLGRARPRSRSDTRATLAIHPSAPAPHRIIAYSRWRSRLGRRMF